MQEHRAHGAPEAEREPEPRRVPLNPLAICHDQLIDLIHLLVQLGLRVRDARLIQCFHALVHGLLDRIDRL